LDGFTFYDNLEYFCNLNYDYTAAPWEYGNFRYKNQKETIWYVGCGGVSLRKISKFIELTGCTEVKKQAAYESEDMIIVSSSGVNVAPVDVAREFCVTEYYDSVREKLPMFLHWINHMEDEGYRSEIRKAGYNLPDTVPYHVQWNKRKRMELTHYWISEYSINCISNAIVEMTGRQIDKCYVWGTGANAIIITRMFRELGIEIEAYIDNDEKKWESFFMDRKVLNPSLVHKKMFVFVSPSKSDSIVLQLINLNFKKNKEFITWKEFVVVSGLFKGGMC
jgi:hypothetical protein